MKIAFFGTPAFALPILESLIDSEHEIILVVSQPDRPKGRSMEVEHTPVKKIAALSQIPVLQPEKAADNTFLSEYKKYSPDLNIIVAYGQILPDELIYHPKYTSINIHASLLPKYRGASPINWALINGDIETGITYQFIEKRLDAGDIISQEKLLISDLDDAVSLFDKLSRLSADTVLDVIKMVDLGSAPRIKQDETKATTVKLLKKEDGRLDFNNSALSIFNKIRGLVPWPCAYCMFKGKTLKILSASLIDCPSEHLATQSGTIIAKVKGKGFVIKTSDSCIIAKIVQPESGKKMNGSDFANGHLDLIGIKLQ